MPSYCVLTCNGRNIELLKCGGNMAGKNNGRQSQDVYVFLSGLSFLEYYGNTLLITTPPVQSHEHWIGNPNQLENLTRWTKDIDWSQVLAGGKIRAFPPEILQFSRRATKVGTLKRVKGDLQITL